MGHCDRRGEAQNKSWMLDQASRGGRSVDQGAWVLREIKRHGFGMKDREKTGRGIDLDG
jgi:hypothetical protein